MKMSDIIKALAEATPEEKAELRKALVGTGVKRVSGELVRRSDLPFEVRLNKQMTVLVKALPTNKLCDIHEWGKLAIENGLETQQPPERIAAYYKKNLLNLGLITTDPITEKPKVIRKKKEKEVEATV
jgi:hypothetical protein